MIRWIVVGVLWFIFAIITFDYHGKKEGFKDGKNMIVELILIIYLWWILWINGFIEFIGKKIEKCDVPDKYKMEDE